MTQVDRSMGLVGNTAIKAPCRLASTVNIAVLNGLLTVDGVVTVAGDRVLLTAQASSVDNGIWVADSGEWSRAQDCDGALDLVFGTLVKVNEGTNQGFLYCSTTTDPIVVGSTSIAFTPASSTLAVISAFMQTMLDDTTAAVARETMGAFATSGGTLTGLLTQAAGADIASAATINLTAATGNSPRITGTTATSAVTMNTGQWCLVVANAAWPLTYHATTNKISGGASYTLTAGDQVLYHKDLSGIVHGFIMKADGTAVVAAAVVLPSGHLSGLTLSNNGTDAINDIDIATGKARDKADSEDLALDTALPGKQLDVAWAVGSAAGLRDTGLIANATWHIHAIKRPDTGVVDVIASLAADEVGTMTVTIASPAVVTETGHGRVVGSGVVFTTTGTLPTGLTAGTLYYVISAGLTADAYQLSATQGGAAVNTSGSQSGVHTAKGTPTLPANYTKFRCIGAILRESAAIVAFNQRGDEFLRNASVLDINANNPGVSAVSRTLSVPTGRKVRAMFHTLLSSSDVATSTSGLISELDRADEAPSETVAPLATTARVYTSANGVGADAARMEVRTNKLAAVRSRLRVSSASVTLYIATVGWIDSRGRD